MYTGFSSEIVINYTYANFLFAHNYTADEYKTTSTMIRVDGQKMFSKKLKTRQFQSIRPVNDCHHSLERSAKTSCLKASVKRSL